MSNNPNSFVIPPLSQIRSEADVEEKIIIPLFMCLGLIQSAGDYSMRVPVTMHSGREIVTKEADIVIYREGKPFVVIEAKRPEERLSDNDIAQLDSYTMWLQGKYGVACDGVSFILRGYFEGNERVYLINKKLAQLEQRLVREAILGSTSPNVAGVPRYVIQDQSNTFSSLLRQIHKDIRDIDKLDPTLAFDEWSKLLFMKIHEEKWSKEHNGNRRLSYKKFNEERANENAAAYIGNLFKKTCETYPNVFGSTPEAIGLSIPAIGDILEKFDAYYINEIPMDVKGKAYEIFLSSTFRGKGLGQFFTPRPVVDFMINLVDISLHTTVLDPACGTGGFLISAFQKIRQSVLATPEHVFEAWGTSKSCFLEAVKQHQIFGVDAEPRATKTAKMNMIMWGDGENVVRGNGLSDKDITNAEYQYRHHPVSLVLANPPFGNKEKDEAVLAQYSLYREHGIQKTECLFIEKALSLLAPGGELAIVIPDAILGCANGACVRTLIQRYAQIKAVVSLPKHTFAPSGVPTISTSVLYVKKFCKEYLDEIAHLSNEAEINTVKERYGYGQYNIFMGMALQIGYEPNGAPTRTGVNDLDGIYASYLLAKEQGMYAGEVYHKLSDNSFVISSSRLAGRIDARYYWFNDILSNLKDEFVALEDYIDIVSDVVLPKQDSPEDTFSILSVTNTHGVLLDEDDDKKYEVEGRNITRAKIVHEGDITYNPYRVNVGSIGVVGAEHDGLLISPSYVVFRVKNGLDAKVLCATLKNKFYSSYIDIFGIGSIRTSLSQTMLKKILIPKSLVGSAGKVSECYNRIAVLKSQITQVEDEMQNYISERIR